MCCCWSKKESSCLEPLGNIYYARDGMGGVCSPGINRGRERESEIFIYFYWLSSICLSLIPLHSIMMIDAQYISHTPLSLFFSLSNHKIYNIQGRY